jgi:hypothetical protein
VLEFAGIRGESFQKTNTPPLFQFPFLSYLYGSIVGIKRESLRERREKEREPERAGRKRESLRELY